MTAHVIAVTTAGLEALSARFEGSETLDHRAQLLYALGDAYPRSGSESDDPRVLNREIAAVQSQVARSLPDALRAALKIACPRRLPTGGRRCAARPPAYAEPDDTPGPSACHCLRFIFCGTPPAR